MQPEKNYLHEENYDQVENVTHPERYSSHQEFTPEQLSIHNLNLLIAGCGAGSAVVPRLMDYGYSTNGILILVDPDKVEWKNLNRQPYLEEHVGLNKAIALQDLIKQRNSEMQTQANPEGVTRDNVEDLVSSVDVIIEMIDISQPQITLALHKEAQRQKKPVITGFDVGDVAIAYVFAYHQPEQMTAEQFLGIPPQFSLEDIEELSSLGLAAQFVLRRPSHAHGEYFQSIEEAKQYYESLPTKEEFLSLLSPEMQQVVFDLLSGNRMTIPQSPTAAAALGLTQERLLDGLIRGEEKLRVAPASAALDINNIIYL